MRVIETPTERNDRIYSDSRERGEPVFVVRAKDRLAISVLTNYRMLATSAGVDEDFIEAVDALKAEFTAWRNDHKDEVKTPDL